MPIAHVVPELPAGNRLRPGDVILGVDGRPLAANESLASLEFLLATRPRREAVALCVRRANREMSVELPISEPASPPSNLGPAEFLSQASRVLRLFGTVCYSVAYPNPEVFTSRLELQFAPGGPSARSAARKFLTLLEFESPGGYELYSDLRNCPERPCTPSVAIKATIQWSYPVT